MYGIDNILNNVSESLLNRGLTGLGYVPPMKSKSGNAFDIDYVKVDDIKTDEKNFQNRQAKFSEKSVQAIIKAVKNGAFNWFAFDPVLLWKNPDGKLFVLSGHSRTEAFRRLAAEKPVIEVDGLTFDRIPAKIYKGDFVSAKNLALNSNALSTPETLLERADFYRKQREGLSKADSAKLREKALRENQGQVIWDLSYIPEGGLTDDFLRRFKMQEDSENAFENYVRAVNIAQWIGKAFQIYKGLSKIHDTELFNFLNDNYGNKSGQYNSFSKLNERLAVLYPRNVANDKKVDSNGDYETPFGLVIYAKNDKELAEIEELKKAADKARRELRKKIDDLRGRSTDKAQVFEIVTPYFNEYINTLLEWWRTLDNEKKRSIDKRQTALFGVADFEQHLNGFCRVDGLGKPTIKFEFESNEELKNFLKENKENLIDSYIDVDYEETESSRANCKRPNIKSKANKALSGIDFTKKQPSAVFNCPESMLICNGYKPTYTRLKDYSGLIDSADGAYTFVGTGFDKTTLNTLVSTCQKYYKQVKRLAKHLADKDPIQTAFNIWHWEHVNLKYDYDAPGREEIRTPARCWYDRANGVDCDCLAVFTACLLLNLGYSPKFEIVGFGNQNKYSHIFVNLNGVAIDRVLPVFNQRAPLISKTLFMEIPVYQLSGVPLNVQNRLNGIYENTLSKVFTRTATPEEMLNFRKTQVLVTLSGIDENAFRLAGIVMPYVTDIDEQGAYYFDNGEIAQIAADGEDEIIRAEQRGASAEELSGIFKKIKKAVKKVANKVGNAVKTVAKATTKVVKSAVKSTANAVKASANLVKAGAQAVTGQGSKAKATLKKVATQAKAAVVNPVKDTAKATKDVVKVTVVNPTKAAVKATVNTVKKVVQIAGKVFKVIFIKLNPATILIRNSLRLLVALNFLGMASRMNVANMTEAQAINAGYTSAMWNEAKKAKDRVERFFTKMGGKKENIDKAIVNGAKKKPLFKGGYKADSKIVETGSDDASLSGCAPVLTGIDGLGAAVTIGSALAAVGAFIAKIWGWIKNIVAKGANVVSKVANVASNVASKAAAVVGGNTTTPTTNNETQVQDLTDNTTTDGGNKKKWLLWLLGIGGAATVFALATSKKRK